MSYHRLCRFAFALGVFALASACTPAPPPATGNASGAASGRTVSPEPSGSPAVTTPVPAGSAGASPVPGASASPPAAGASASPSAAGASASPSAAGASASPSRAVTATPTPLLEAPNAPPQILGYSMSASTVHVGDTLAGTVRTSSNVASVEVRIAGYSYVMSKVGVGEFTLAYKVPNIPKIFRRTYTMTIIARNTRGDATERSTSITIR